MALDAGIWQYSKAIMGTLAVLFLVSVGVDGYLWYKVQTSRTATQTLNEIIASQVQKPETPENKAKLLEAFIAAHQEAVAQAAPSSNANKTKTTINTPASTQQKIDLLNSFIKK